MGIWVQALEDELQRPPEEYTLGPKPNPALNNCCLAVSGVGLELIPKTRNCTSLDITEAWTRNASKILGLNWASDLSQRATS